MNILELAARLHEAVRDQLERQWPDFKITKIEEESETHYGDRLYPLRRTEVTFDVTAVHGSLEKRCKIGIRGDGSAVVTREEMRFRQ